jgi:hypothetical protein
MMFKSMKRKTSNSPTQYSRKEKKSSKTLKYLSLWWRGFNYLWIFAFHRELKHNSREKRGMALNEYKFSSENLKVRQPFEYVAGKPKQSCIAALPTVSFVRGCFAGNCILTGSTELRYFKVDGSMEKKWNTVISADLKRLSVSGIYMSRCSRKG